MKNWALKLALATGLFMAAAFAAPEAHAGSWGIGIYGGGPYNGYSVSYNDGWGRGHRGRGYYGGGYYGGHYGRPYYRPYYRPVVYAPVYRPVYRHHRAPWCRAHGVHHFHRHHRDRYYDDRYYDDRYYDDGYYYR